LERVVATQQVPILTLQTSLRDHYSFDFSMQILSNLTTVTKVKISPGTPICDIAMPEEGGYAALRRMRALEEARGVAASQRIPAIALTALSGNEERLRALGAGFQMHVAKPVDPVESILVIDNIAGMWRQETASN
jgi:CheY-like chemotaxis protein